LSDPQNVRAELDALRREVDRLAAELAEARAHASRLESLAHEDPLTGLQNRRGFMRDLAGALAHRTRYGTSIAILMADLDGFKSVNDSHGHESGDRALAHVAALLRANLRASDSVARLGGDEFAAILWHVDEAVARRKASALEALIEGAPLRLDGGTALALRPSIGSAALNPGEGAEAALTRADEAMYARKADRARLRQG
jgi:diguanylate cyclase (GGDEF)-like protein